MARTDAVQLETAVGTAMKLAEIYGGLIAGIRATAISEQLKNRRYSGDPVAGSVEINRFKLSASKAEGTARTANKGDSPLNSGQKTVNLNVHKEIIEEVNKFDIHASRLVGFMSARVLEHINSMAGALDKAFFTEAETDGSRITPSASITTVEDRAELLFQTLEAKSNDWVDGCDRRNLALCLKPARYAELHDHMDQLSVPTVDGGSAEINAYHGVPVYRNSRQSKNYVIMHMGAIGQPLVVNQYTTPEKINLSNRFSIELFYHFGTQAIMPDLIHWIT